MRNFTLNRIYSIYRLHKFQLISTYINICYLHVVANVDFVLVTSMAKNSCFEVVFLSFIVSIFWAVSTTLSLSDVDSS